MDAEPEGEDSDVDRTSDRTAVPLARLLTATNRTGVEARLREQFAPDEVAQLLAASDARILAIRLATATAAADLVASLRTFGVVAAAAGDIVATVATTGQLLDVAAREPRWAAELAALAATLRNVLEPPTALRLRERRLDLSAEARVMGILNVTPDSFYERIAGIPHAVERAAAMAGAGAALVDIGGQSYAHWNPRVAAEEERSRVVPAVEAIVAAGIDIALSIDTFKEIL
jgi:hypothetical protein